MGFKVVFNYYIHQETLVDLAKEKNGGMYQLVDH